MPAAPPPLLRPPVVAFDIEVAGLEWEEVDEATRHYLLSRHPEDDDQESIRHRLALVRGLGRVVAIGMWNLQKDQGAVLVGWIGRRGERRRLNAGIVGGDDQPRDRVPGLG